MQCSGDEWAVCELWGGLSHYNLPSVPAQRMTLSPGTTDEQFIEGLCSEASATTPCVPLSAQLLAQLFLLGTLIVSFA